ncbi:DUF6869 domain-containing protein [Thioclava sp.]|uniref:DUF6869 domain-containing protein n=1 Tax=Thioclava sp. TaxID=1933450 RepID=UPI003AA85CF4
MTPLPLEMVSVLCNAANAPEDVHSVEALVALWLTDNHDEPEGEDFPWSVLCVFELREYPDVLWAFIRQALAGCETIWQVVMLSAGPLEDLITDHGADFIDKIEREARHSARFAYALTGVWPADEADPALWARIETARAAAMPTGLDMGGPLPAR